MGKKSELPAETRVDVVLALLRREELVAQLQRCHGIDEQTLYHWREGFVSPTAKPSWQGKKAARRHSPRSQG
ncbi:hypothetical protein [Methylocaldum sp.]|uniref:hypothetical protein n=1 Tax=Methylocaldum sp. TaxID=1969727 RepID=UPI002D48BEF5|nr:hypothetical protein [Methylocaldum sp.]HYE37676.1 hypothetical protein [Methylocaldum sp.]